MGWGVDVVLPSCDDRFVLSIVFQVFIVNLVQYITITIKSAHLYPLILKCHDHCPAPFSYSVGQKGYFPPFPLTVGI